MTKILVVNLTRFGDMIQSTVLIQGLKRMYPDSDISFLVNNNFSQTCSMIPFVDHFYVLDFMKVWEALLSDQSSIEKAYAYLNVFFKKIRENQFDRIINITPHYIGIFSSFLAGDESMVNSRMTDWTKYFINISRRWSTLPFHVVDLYTKIAGLSPQKILPKLHISKNPVSFANEFLNHQGLGKNEIMIGFNPGASEAVRQWPIEYFIELGTLILENTNTRLILFGTETEKKMGEHIQNNLPGKVINAIGKTGPMELAALMSKTNILVTNDTGTMHVASACGTKIIGIYLGKAICTTTGPYGQGHIGLHPKIACHPCEKPEKCPHKSCRYMISPRLVFFLVNQLLKDVGEINNRTHPEQSKKDLKVQFSKVRQCLSPPPSRDPAPQGPVFMKTINGMDMGNELSTANVFISDFDKSGFLDFLPMWKSNISLSTLCRKMLRVIWNLSLSGDEIEGSVNHAIQQFVYYIKKHYFIENVDRLKWEWQRVEKKLKKLVEMTEYGIHLSEGVEQAGADPIHHIKILQQITGDIEILDDKIMSLGEASSEFATLTHMFSLEKEKLDGKKVVDLARQIKDIYCHLNSRCELLMKLGGCFFQKI